MDAATAIINTFTTLDSKSPSVIMDTDIDNFSDTAIFDALTQGNVSIWDFILFNQLPEAQAYINMLQVKDDTKEDNNELMLIQRVLDARVETSVRFSFINPLVGQHGYLHINNSKSANKNSNYVLLKGSSPLHFAVHLQHYDFIKLLLEAGSDMSALDEKNQTAYRMARLNNDEKAISIFQQHRNFGYNLRRKNRLNEQIIATLSTKIEENQNLLAGFEIARTNLMAQVVSLWWRFITASVRKNSLSAIKIQLAKQLENLVQVSTTTVNDLENDKRSLIDQLAMKNNVIAELQMKVKDLTLSLSATKTSLNMAEAEIHESKVLKSDLTTLRNSLQESAKSFNITSNVMQQQQRQMASLLDLLHAKNPDLVSGAGQLISPSLPSSVSVSVLTTLNSPEPSFNDPRTNSPDLLNVSNTPIQTSAAPVEADTAWNTPLDSSTYYNNPHSNEFSLAAKNAANISKMARAPSTKYPSYQDNYLTVDTTSDMKPSTLVFGSFKVNQGFPLLGSQTPASNRPTPHSGNASAMPFVPRTAVPVVPIKSPSGHKNSITLSSESFDNLLDLKVISSVNNDFETPNPSKLSPISPIHRMIRKNDDSPKTSIPLSQDFTEKSFLSPPDHDKAKNDISHDNMDSIVRPHHYDFSALLGRDDDNESVKKDLSSFPDIDSSTPGTNPSHFNRQASQVEDTDDFLKQQQTFHRLQEENRKKLYDRDAPSSNRSDDSDDSSSRNQSMDETATRMRALSQEERVFTSPKERTNSFIENRERVDSLLRSPIRLSIRDSISHSMNYSSPVVIPFDFGFNKANAAPYSGPGGDLNNFGLSDDVKSSDIPRSPVANDNNELDLL